MYNFFTYINYQQYTEMQYCTVFILCGFYKVECGENIGIPLNDMSIFNTSFHHHQYPTWFFCMRCFRAMDEDEIRNNRLFHFTGIRHKPHHTSFSYSKCLQAYFTFYVTLYTYILHGALGYQLNDLNTTLSVQLLGMKLASTDICVQECESIFL